MKVQSFVAAACAASLFAGATPARAAAEYGTAAEAKALLEKAVAAVTADEASAIARFNKADGGFRDRDLYVFCAGPDGKIDANPNPANIGNSMQDTKDKTGKPFGQEIVKVAQEGKFNEVSYMWPRPGTTDPVPKTSYVTRVAHHICGVGYYQ